MVRGLVPSMSDMSAGHSVEQDRCKSNFHSRNGGTWSVTRNTQSGTEGHSDVTVGLVPT